MADSQLGRDELVDRLIIGFGSLLEQMQSLANENRRRESQNCNTRNNRCDEVDYNVDAVSPIELEGLPDRSGFAQEVHVERQAGVKPMHDDDFLHILRDLNPERHAAIVDGIKAWRILKDPEVIRNTPLIQVSRASKTPSDRTTREPIKKFSNRPTSNGAKALEKDFTTPGIEGNLQCPFASMTAAGSKKQKRAAPTLGMPPTPPEAIDPIAAEFHADFASPLSPSIPRCPIRFLDQHSPDEIAKYFDKHKHEIPRSHEICVKRYQSNADSIRRLDAKYGNLVNMVQGLGVKHQPMLPAKEPEEDEEGSIAVMDQNSAEKVEKWAEGVKGSDAQEGTDTHGSDEATPSEGDGARESHFDRPLKEIRVGESPSRPWGISVPYVHGDKSDIGKIAQTSSPPQNCPIDPKTTKIKQDVNMPRPHKPRTDSVSNAEMRPDAASAKQAPQYQPKVVFNGPAFFGYAPEQVATLLQQWSSILNLPQP